MNKRTQLFALLAFVSRLSVPPVPLTGQLRVRLILTASVTSKRK